MPAGKSTCSRLWKQLDDFRKVGEGSLPKAWKAATGQPQLAETVELLDACEEKEKDGHTSLSKADICTALFELSKKRSEEKSKWKPDQEREPSRPSADRHFTLCCDRHSKKLLHGKAQKKSMTRLTGERSLWSSTSVAGVEPSIGLVVGKDEQPNQFKKPVEEASDGAQKLVRIVSEVSGGEPPRPA